MFSCFDRRVECERREVVLMDRGGLTAVRDWKSDRLFGEGVLTLALGLSGYTCCLGRVAEAGYSYDADWL